MDFTNDKIYLLMQVNDSVFPIGGYTQSYGLETYILRDKVRDEKNAYEYISTNLQTSYLHTELLSASLAFDAAKSGDLEKILELDELLHVIKTPVEMRDASIKLGGRFVKTISTTTEIKFDSDIFNRYVEKVNKKECEPNHAVAYGIFCAAINVDKKTALSFFIYAATSAMVTNSVKAVPLSQTQGQQILYRCSQLFSSIVEKVMKMDESMLGLSMPGFDIRSMQHETLYSRLYMS